MARIKALAEIGSKWSRVTPGRTQDFREGVENPRRDWAGATAAAEDSYKAGVLEAANAGRFGKGVKKAGTQKWQEKTITKGTNRWGEGVRGATTEYQEGFAPYHEVIERTELPPRGPKGDPRNIDRVGKLAAALHDRKVRG